MNHETNTGVIIHLLILGLMILGVAYIGYTIWNEEYEKEYNDWNNDLNK